MWGIQDNKFGGQHMFLYLHALPYNANNKETSQSPLHSACAESSSSLAQDALTICPLKICEFLFTTKCRMKTLAVANKVCVVGRDLLSSHRE